MKKKTTKKVVGVVITFAGILGIVTCVSNRKEKKDRLDDDNEYISNQAIISKGSDNNSSIYANYIKRILDIVLSILGLIILSPLFVVISAAIIIDDPGPVIFRQKRVGKGCAFFYCHKFRSMKISTPHDVPTHQLSDPERYITRVGRVLRRTSLDELPQIWDIMRGKMSIIGPRPALWNQNDLVAEREKYGVNNVMPGLTGLAQINGRDELEIVDKARIDGEYVKKYGFLIDANCFLKTIASVLKREGVVEGGTGNMSVSCQIKSVDLDDVGFEDYGYKKSFHIDINVYKKILITGANSYIGESFKAYCEGNYPSIKCETLDMVDGRWKTHPFTDSDGRPYDVVFHVAGIAHADVGKTTVEEQKKYYEVNTILAIETAQKAKEAGVLQFIFISSMIIYGRQERIDAYTLPQPANFYGNSKWLADKGVRALAVPGKFEVAVLRLPMIYGKGSKGNYSILSKIAKNTQVFPAVSNTRSMLYIENLCEFVAQLSLSGKGGIYFPQNAEYSNTAEMVKSISAVNGSRIWKLRILNPAIIIARHVPGKIKVLANKAFGNNYYVNKLSIYFGMDYQKVGLEESIRRTEE